MSFRIVILGSTGSIGTTTLSVIKNKNFKVDLLTTNKNASKILKQAILHRVKDVIKSCAILALSFFLSELLVFESTFIQLSTSFVSIVGLTFTFLVLLKFEYINITKRN